MASSSSFNQPLHRALLSCNLTLLRILADKHSLDIQFLAKTMYILSDHSRRACHITPLQAAVMTGNYQVCKRLIKEGADFYSLAYNISHPLNIALDNDKFQIAKLLINSGADVCLPQHGFCPMYFAIKSNSPEYIVEAIINSGFSPNTVIEGMFCSTSLHRAVACNNVPVVKLLMKYKVNCNLTDTDQGFTPVHIAVKLRLSHMVKLLAEYGTNLEIECKEGYPPLFYAISNNDLESVDILLQFGAKLDHLSSFKQMYPLNFAACLCRKEIIKIFMKKKANVKIVAPGTGNLPLHSAAMSQRGKFSEESKEDLKNIVQILIENGSQVDSPNKYGYTPVQLAIKEQNFKIVEVLVREGSSVNRTLDQGTNFHFVAKLASKELVNTFFEYGADYSVLDKNGITPYHMAILNPNKNVLHIFWRFRCPFDLPLKENSRKPLYRTEIIQALENQKKFISGIRRNDVTVMYDALANGAEVKGCSVEMLHPLHFAARNGFNSVVHLMLDNGDLPNSVNNQGETALHLAASNGHYYVCLYLLRYGASYNILSRSTGKTPQDLAAENNHNEIVDLLKEINRLYKSHNEQKIINKLNAKIEDCNSDLYLSLALVNSVNRQGSTLMAVALRKKFNRLASRIMSFRLQNKEIFE